jgi:hypothetical protein
MGPDNNTIHLVEATRSADLTPLHPSNVYACLSYCWGGPQRVTLTKSSYERFLRGINVLELDQTLQDAVRVTRELGIEFLWIDALCIIQDCDQDKSIQLPQMCEIYSEATVTIAAGDCIASSHGFLRRPGMATNNAGSGLDDQDVPHEIPFATGGTVLLYEDGERYVRKWHSFVLNTRGWTLQEMLLSRRVLFYTAHDVLWLCRRVDLNHRYDADGTASSELGISERDVLCPSRYSYFPDLTLLDRSNWHEVMRSATDRRGFYELWESFLEDYFRRKLTFSSDRLRAIEGLAKALSNISGQRYLYGHWEDSLVFSLGWRYTEIDWDPIIMAPLAAKSDRVLVDYGLNTSWTKESVWDPIDVPSWSWASARSPVFFGFYDKDIEIMASLVGRLPQDPDLEQLSEQKSVQNITQSSMLGLRAGLTQRARYGTIELRGFLISKTSLIEHITKDGGRVGSIPDKRSWFNKEREAFLLYKTARLVPVAVFLELKFKGKSRKQASEEMIKTGNAHGDKGSLLKRFKRKGIIWCYWSGSLENILSSCGETNILLE